MRRMGGKIRIASLLALFLMVLSACGSTEPTTTPAGTSGTTPKPTSSVTVALVTDIGGLNDGGFNQLAYGGYTKAQKQYGFKSVVIQTQSQNDYVQNLTTAAQQADMVIAVGFLMQTPLDRIAKQYPNKKFAIVDGCAVPDATTGNCENLPNVAPLFFKEQEAGCLVGALAGQMEVDGKAKAPKLLGNNKIGAIGGLSIPPVNRYIAGYKYCAQKVDPKISVVISYSNDFADPSKCKAQAESQFAEGADILFQVAGGCGVGVLDAATAKNVYSIGVDADQGKDSSGKVRPSVITSAEKKVDVAVYDIINDAQTGTYAKFVSDSASTTNPPRFDLANGGVGFATPSSDVPADAAATANSYASQIQSGSLVPPADIPK
ncbi:MAG TPA: BMP family ABC transporter substrate-binding protein [Ktedonobacteraceae bacterium]